MYAIVFLIDSVPFTKATCEGKTSLGGSESACVMLAQALATRGHDVHIIATKLEAEGEYAGVTWHDVDILQDLFRFFTPDVFCALRQPLVYAAHRIPAKLNLLWNQDLLHTDAQIMPHLAQVDRLVYVSDFHRDQWAGKQPLLGGERAWVTRNGIDPSQVPDLRQFSKKRDRFLYISRPERGLEPLLQMWPAIRAQLPDATLGICRYVSMYDGEGTKVKAMVDHYDRLTAQVQQETGGIDVLGSLSKTALYEQLASARLLLYPGIEGFAETSCLAAIEAQACGTPLIGSWKGALPETVHPEAGILLDGDADSPAYQEAFVEHVVRLSANDVTYARMRQAGLAWVLPRYDVATIAAEWEAQIGQFFAARHQANRLGVLRMLLHEDNHSAGQVLAAQILQEHPEEPEATEALALCTRVIHQEEQTAEHYAQFAIQDPEAEAAQPNGRLVYAAQPLIDVKPATILDVACGNGSMALVLARALPEARYLGVDYSEGVLALARGAIEAAGFADRVTFQQGEWTTLTGTYDAIFCGEFLEHIAEPWALLDRLEQHCAPDGVIVLTTPCGPFVELLPWGIPRHRGHLHSFTMADLATMGGGKRGFKWQYISAGVTPRGTPVGFWLIAYQPGGLPAVPLDYTHQIQTTRPYQRLAVSMIVKNGADWLRKCLKSVRDVADEIVIYDTGSTDGSPELAEAEGATVIQGDWPEDFSEARNRALRLVEDRAEWVLWIDADEHLEQPEHLRRYLTDASCYNAYVVRQNHLMADVPSFHDKPCRVFRTGRGVKFFGCVHEQPEQTPDNGIWPAYELPDVDILHLGYHRETVRREKLLSRNFALLQKAILSGSPRELDYVLVLREYLNLALFAKEQAGGRIDNRVKSYAARAVAMFEEKFADPAHRYHDLAWPFYQQAAKVIGGGIEAEWAFAATPGRLQAGTRAKPERFVMSSPEAIQRELSAKLTKWMADLAPATFRVDPAVTRNGSGGWGEPAHTSDSLDPVTNDSPIYGAIV